MYLKVADNDKHKRLTIDGLDLHRNPQGSFMYAFIHVAAKSSHVSTVNDFLFIFILIFQIIT